MIANNIIVSRWWWWCIWFLFSIAIIELVKFLSFLVISSCVVSVAGLLPHEKTNANEYPHAKGDTASDKDGWGRHFLFVWFNFIYCSFMNGKTNKYEWVSKWINDWSKEAWKYSMMRIVLKTIYYNVTVWNGREMVIEQFLKCCINLIKTF